MLDTGSFVKEDAIELAIFDIDGPVTHPESRRIEQFEILDLMLDFVNERGYIAYNTGRASAIAFHRVISPLLSRALERGMDPKMVSCCISILPRREELGVSGMTSLAGGAIKSILQLKSPQTSASR